MQNVKLVEKTDNFDRFHYLIIKIIKISSYTPDVFLVISSTFSPHYLLVYGKSGIH